MNKSLYSLLTIITVTFSIHCVFAEEKTVLESEKDVMDSNSLQITGINKANASSDEKPSRKELVYYVNLGRASDVEILINRGASVDETNDAGVPIVALAAGRVDNENINVVRLLVEAGADINKTDRRGQNALFYAVRIGNKKIVEYLLSEDIHYDAVDNVGNNARVVAYRTGHNDIVEMLDNYVRGKNDAARQQYLIMNKKFEDRYNAYNTAMQKQIKKSSDESLQNKDITPLIRISKEVVHAASFSSCAAAYWKFCKSIGQSTEFSAESLEDNINIQSSRTKEFSGKLVMDHGVSVDEVKNIISISENRIDAQLSEFSSNEVRRDNDVGTIFDMNKRCNEIADMWNVTTYDSPMTSSYMIRNNSDVNKNSTTVRIRDSSVTPAEQGGGIPSFFR